MREGGREGEEGEGREGGRGGREGEEGRRRGREGEWEGRWREGGRGGRREDRDLCSKISIAGISIVDSDLTTDIIEPADLQRFVSQQNFARSTR